MQLADERLVRIGAAIQQLLDQIQRAQLVGMIGAQPRTVVGAHVGRGVVHVNREVQRPVIRVGAQIEQVAGQIEPIVDDGEHRRREAVAVGQLRIRPTLDERGDGFVVTVARRKHQGGEAARGVIGVLAFVDARDATLAIRVGA